MRLQLLPSTIGGVGPAQLLSSYLIDQHICIDAGSIGFHAELSQQLAIKHVFITHSHSDHVASLPTFLDAHFGVDSDFDVPVTIYGTEATIASLRLDMLNDRHWPDFIRICEESGRDLVRLHVLEEGVAIQVEGISITAIPVDHIVETVAYIIEDDQSACAIVTDTGPTDQIWKSMPPGQGADHRGAGVRLSRTIAMARRCVEAPDSEHLQVQPSQGPGSGSVTISRSPPQVESVQRDRRGTGRIVASWRRGDGERTRLSGLNLACSVYASSTNLLLQEQL